VVFVVDAADEMRYKLAAYEFDQVINHPDIRLRNIPFLIFLNKTDVRVGLCSNERVLAHSRSAPSS